MRRRTLVLPILALTLLLAGGLAAYAAAQSPETTPARPGAVYAATNDPTGNEIRVFNRQRRPARPGR